MSNPSQESSPITQWTDKVDEILYSVENYALANPTKDTNPFIRTQIQAITSATIELITQIIGPDDDVTGLKNCDVAVGYRNDLRHQLRQSLKEL